MKIRTQLSLGYLLVFSLITGIAAISYNGFISHAESNKWVAHTHEVISEAHRIEKQGVGGMFVIARNIQRQVGTLLAFVPRPAMSCRRIWSCNHYS